MSLQLRLTDQGSFWEEVALGLGLKDLERDGKTCRIRFGDTDVGCVWRSMLRPMGQTWPRGHSRPGLGALGRAALGVGGDPEVGWARPPAGPSSLGAASLTRSPWPA